MQRVAHWFDTLARVHCSAARAVVTIPKPRKGERAYLKTSCGVRRQAVSQRSRERLRDVVVVVAGFDANL